MAGVPVRFWYKVFTACHFIQMHYIGSGEKTAAWATVALSQYPNGGCWMEQEALLSDVFNIMADEVKRSAERG